MQSFNNRMFTRNTMFFGTTRRVEFAFWKRSVLSNKVYSIQITKIVELSSCWHYLDIKPIFWVVSLDISDNHLHRDAIHCFLFTRISRTEENENCQKPDVSPDPPCPDNSIWCQTHYYLLCLSICQGRCYVIILLHTQNINFNISKVWYKL